MERGVSAARHWPAVFSINHQSAGCSHTSTGTGFPFMLPPVMTGQRCTEVASNSVKIIQIIMESDWYFLPRLFILCVWALHVCDVLLFQQNGRKTADQTKDGTSDCIYTPSLTAHTLTFEVNVWPSACLHSCVCVCVPSFHVNTLGLKLWPPIVFLPGRSISCLVQWSPWRPIPVTAL